MSSPSERLRTINLDTALKATMIQLCRDLGLPHSGRKVQLANRLRSRRSTLPPTITTSSTATSPLASQVQPAQASCKSPRPTLSSTLTAASTSSSDNTALQPSDTGAAPSNLPQPAIQTYAGGTWQPNFALQVPSIGTTFPLALASQAQLGRAPLPITLPPTASPVNTSAAMLPAITSPLFSQVQPVNIQLIAQQAVQLATEQAVAWILTSPSQPQGLVPFLHNFSQPASHSSPHLATIPTTVAGAFQPPAATTETTSSLQAALATHAAAPTQPGPSNIYLAPLSGTIPTIPAKFITAAAGELVEYLGRA